MNVKYIAFFESESLTGNEKKSFEVDSADLRTANKLARLKAKEFITSEETQYTRIMELVREDTTSNRIYSNGEGQTKLVCDVKI